MTKNKANIKDRITSSSLSSLVMSLFLFGASLIAQASVAAQKVNSNSVDYGTFYLVEQLSQETAPWRLGYSTSMEYGNSYSNVFGQSFVVEHSIHRFAYAGLQFNKYFFTSTQTMEVLAKELDVRDLRYSIQNPSYSIYPVATFIPISGRVNFLGNKPFNLEVALRMGIGAIVYQGSSPTQWGMIYSIRPAFALNSQWRIQAGIGHELQSVFNRDNRVVRLQGDVGVGFSF